ncbi:MAG: DNA topoisomerase IB [Betaproteobacteria bacterium]
MKPSSPRPAHPAPPATPPGLRYTSDASPGLHRIARKGAFAFRKPDGKLVRDRATLHRIAALVLPPAWTDVWICPHENGHLQATGHDQRGRKQYRYHPSWTAERDANKFESLVDIARTLPRIRRAVRRHLALPGLPKERVLAAVVQVMDKTFVRVGGEKYRRENGSLGITTLRGRNVRARGTRVRFDFTGKSGKRHQPEVEDPAVARVVRRCLDLPGYNLFQYEHDDGPRIVSAADVNDYLRGIAGRAFSSKDFRTWGGTVRAAGHLRRCERPTSQRAAKAQVRDAIAAAASALGNTPAVCRKSYVHPQVVTAWLDGVDAMPVALRGLRAEEQAALGLLVAMRDAARKGAPARRLAGASRRAIAASHPAIAAAL